MITPKLDHIRSVLCLGAHSDDIEIGCGGTMLKLTENNPDISVHWIVFSGTKDRKTEAITSAEIFLEQSRKKTIEVHQFEDTRFPYTEAQGLKECFAQLSARINPDVIFTHRKNDAHQDHRLISELTWQHFRNNLIFEYEIAKYEGDLGQPSLFSPISEKHKTRKLNTISNVFRSQRDKYWFNADNFEALLRLRGLECQSSSGFAEAFHCAKMII